MRAANLVLRFLLELFALDALGFWGATWARSWGARVVLGIGAPLLAAVFWGMSVAPRAPLERSTPTRVLLGILVFGAAALALTARGHARLAVTSSAIAVANVVLILVWRQDRLPPRGAR